MKYMIKRVEKGTVHGEVEIDDSLLSLSEFKTGLHNLHTKLFGEYQGDLRFEKTKKGKILVYNTKGALLLALEPVRPFYRRLFDG